MVVLINQGAVAVLRRKGGHGGREERAAGSSLIEILEVC